MGGKVITEREFGDRVRLARQTANLSMDELARAANVSRSTVHRIETGSGIRAQPQRLARVLVTLGITPRFADSDVLPTDDEKWRSNVIRWMRKIEGGQVESFVKAAGGRVDLVAVRGETVAMIEIRGPGEGANDLTESLKREGWVVTRPT